MSNPAAVRGHSRQVGAALAGLAPGFLLPFVLALVLATRASDRFLFAMSFALIFTNVVAASVESLGLATTGRAAAEGTLTRASVAGFRRAVLLRAIVACALGIPLIYGLYLLRDLRWIDAWPIVAVVGLLPVVSSFASIYSAVLIARSASWLTVLTTGFRSLLPMAAVAVWHTIPLPLLGVFAVAGEVLRAVVLWLAARRDIAPSGPDAGLRSSGLGYQFASVAISQGAPLVDRLFLAGFAAGSITSYELADKLSYAAYQFGYTVLLLRLFSAWAATPTSPIALLWHRFEHDLRIALGLLFALCVAGAVALGALTVGVPRATTWHTSLWWATILLPTIPLVLFHTAATRLLVMLNAERSLPPVIATAFVVNLVADWAFTRLWGPVGIAWSTTLTRLVLTAAYLGVLLWQRHVRDAVERGVATPTPRRAVRASITRLPGGERALDRIRERQRRYEDVAGVEVFSWNPRAALGSTRRLNNFGDLLGPEVVRRIVANEGLTEGGGRLLAIGSVVQFATPGCTVWGAGIREDDPQLPAALRDLDVRAVRGPLTRDALRARGFAVPEVFGDPALLLPLLDAFEQPPDAPRIPVLVIPNVLDPEDYSDYGMVLSPTAPVAQIVASIRRADFVVGSSLHAGVLADAYGTPHRLFRASAEARVKYVDYYAGTGRSDQLAASIRAALDAGPAEPMQWDPAPLLASFPCDLWHGRGKVTT